MMNAKRAGLTIAFAVGLSAATLITLVQQVRGSGDSGTIDSTIDVSWADLGATRVPVSGVRAASGLPPTRPNHPLANDDSLKDVWVLPGGSLVAFGYGSGVEVKIERGDWILNSAGGAPTFFLERAQGFSDEFGVPLPEMLVQVNGSLALHVPQDIGGQGNRGSVSFLLGDGTFVRVYGHLDGETLLDVAESIR